MTKFIEVVPVQSLEALSLQTIWE